MNLFLLYGALLLLYGVKMWLHRDADSAPWGDRQDSRKAVLSNTFSKSIQPRHQLKTLKPLSQWGFCNLLLSDRTKANTHSKRIPIRQTNISNLSTLCVSPDFCVWSKTQSCAFHFAHLQNMCVRKLLLPPHNFLILFSQYFICLRPSLSPSSKEQGKEEGNTVF